MQISFNCDVQTVIFKSFTYLLFDFFQLRSRRIFKIAEIIVSVQSVFSQNSLFRMFSKYKPTNSHTFAPSKLPIGTSKSGLSFFTQMSLLLNKSDFLECMIMLITFLSIVVIVLAKLMACVNKSLKIDG